MRHAKINEMPILINMSLEGRIKWSFFPFLWLSGCDPAAASKQLDIFCLF
jgi:hypothetical protein